MAEKNSLDVLQISSSRMEFFFEQVRAVEEMGVNCDVVCYPSNAPPDEVRRERIHEGLLRKIYGHNPLYYLVRGGHFYPRILRSTVWTNYDIVHINSGMVAPLGLLQPQRPVVLTLWGDDLLGDRLYGCQSEITKRCAKRADHVIVRNEEMRKALPCDASVIPAGIDMTKFSLMDRRKAREKIGWSHDHRHVLFPYPKDQEKKRYPVAKSVVAQVNNQLNATVHLKVVNNVPHHEMPRYYNAADALLLPSLREGSPNTVKEAMACNLPIVVTDVGDVRKRLGPVTHSHVCADDSQLVQALADVLRAGERSNGREYVQDMSLERMGEQIVEIYESLVKGTTPRRKVTV